MSATCIGCGRPKAKQPHTYCRRCRRLVSEGVTPDADDLPTRAECDRANKAMDEYAILRYCAVTT